MKVKRYIADTAHLAIQKMKAELGSDAIILHTRKIKKSGIMGFFSKPVIEVVAAVDEGGKKSEGTSAFSSMVSKHNQNFKQHNSVKPPEVDKYDEKIDKIEDQIKDLRLVIESTFTSLKGAQTEATHNLPPILNKFYKKLIQSNVDKAAAIRIIDKAQSKLNTFQYGVTNIDNCLASTLYEFIGEPQPIIHSVGSKQKIIMLVGPTGVGKTTTLAKLAANFCIADRKKVGLITADTYRIAAVEQLKIYSEILKLPLSIVYKPQEIKGVVDSYYDKDIILIDTAGRNYRDTDQLTEVKAILDHCPNIEVLLALSSSASYSELYGIINAFEFLSKYKLLFTKLDEAPNYGSIINAVHLTNKPLTYFANGQSVPDDLETADPNIIISKYIGD